jgi:hypothetical protein
MKNIIEPSAENILLELKRRALTELVQSEAAYEELVDDLISEKIEWGELQSDEDTIGIREDLVARWPDIQEYMRRQSKDLL